MPDKAAVPRAAYLLAAVGALSASNLYYSQPLLPLIASGFGVSPAAIASLPAVTQAGFACGILTVLPLADMVERRTLVAAMLALLAVAAFTHSLAPTLTLLLLSGFLVGMACIVPQLLTPYAAAIAPKGLEGRSVGLVLSGILSGVLISRVISGLAAAVIGWRSLYAISSVAMLLLAFIVTRTLPPSPATARQGYATLLRSTFDLLRSEPALRRHTLYGATAFAAFMIFWSNYSVHLAHAFGYGSEAAGLFGLAGIAGIFGASLAGRQIDRGRFSPVILVSGAMMAASFLLMLVAGRSVVMLIVGVLLLDAGMALCHSANQSEAFALRPEARGRVNAVYMTGFFLGGALGSTAGAIALTLGGWATLCLVGALVAATIVLGQIVAPVRPLRAVAKASR